MKKIERLLLAVHSAFNSPNGKKKGFRCRRGQDMFQGNAGMQMTPCSNFSTGINRGNEGPCRVDRAPTALSTYLFTYRTLSEFIKAKFKVPTLSSGTQRAVHPRLSDFILLEMGYAVDKLRGYLAILKALHRLATERAHSGEIPFLPLQSLAQAEGRQHRKHSAVRISSLRDLGDTGKTQVTCHHRDLRLLHRHRLCRCSITRKNPPLPG